jgi:hypothetical protein
MICPENFLYVYEDNGMPGKFFELTSALPPPVANISGKNCLGALFFRKVPLETGAPPNFLILPTLLIITTAWRQLANFEKVQITLSKILSCRDISIKSQGGC